MPTTIEHHSYKMKRPTSLLLHVRPEKSESKVVVIQDTKLVEELKQIAEEKFDIYKQQLTLKDSIISHYENRLDQEQTKHATLTNELDKIKRAVDEIPKDLQPPKLVRQSAHIATPAKADIDKSKSNKKKEPLRWK